jgi:hypothetical protein
MNDCLAKKGTLGMILRFPELVCYFSLFFIRGSFGRIRVELGCLAYVVTVITDGEASASKISTKQKKFRNKSYKAVSTQIYLHYHSFPFFLNTILQLT